MKDDDVVIKITLPFGWGVPTVCVLFASLGDADMPSATSFKKWAASWFTEASRK